MASMSISDCSKCRDGNPNIFEAKDPKDIKMHYDKLLASHSGKWSAKIYLEIMETLHGKIDDDQQIDDRMVSEYCPNTKAPTIQPAADSKALKDLANRGHTFVERSYQKIFKNARKKMESPPEKMKPSSGKMKSQLEKMTDFSLPRMVDHTPTSVTYSDGTSQFTDGQGLATRELSRRGCQLMGSGINNYLVELRLKNTTLESSPSLGMISHTMDSQDRQLSVYTSQEENELRGDFTLFAHQTADGLLRNNLNDQATKIKSIIGKPGARLSIPNDEYSLMNLLKQAFLMKDEEIFEFEEKFPKWRRKFVIEKIEQSDQAETVDQSDVETGGTSLYSDNNPKDKEEKLKKIVSKPSRIPYMEEVRRLNRQLFDKIAVKWDRIVEQCANHEDLSLTPNWSRLVGDIRLRSHDPFLGKILKSMKLNSRIRKVFVPYKYRSHAWKRVLRRKEQNKEKVNAQRKMLENFAITSKPVRKIKRNLLECCKNRRAEKDGKDLLNDLVAETDLKAKSDNFSWDEKEIAEHYLKLCAIIKTKKRPNGFEPSNDDDRSEFF